MSEQQALTVVVVENGGRHSEPYLGRGPENDDNCVVFGQHADESAFLLDLRIRENLDRLRANGKQLQYAVLFWDAGSSDRDVLRRSQLVARKLKPGSRIIYATYKSETLATQVRLRRLAKLASEQLSGDDIRVSVWFDETEDARDAAPPMAAAWHRIQRYRAERAERQTAASRRPLPCVTAEFVEPSADYTSSSVGA